MSAPLASWFNANRMNGADDVLAAVEALAAMDELAGPGRFARRGGQAMSRQRLSNCIRVVQRHGFQVVRGGGGEGMGEDFEGDDEYGADEADLDQEIGADEVDVEALEGEDDEYGGDTKEELGADIPKLDYKLKKLQAKKDKWEARYNATPEHRIRKRKRIRRHIGRIDKAIARVEGRKSKKVDRIARKMGVAPAVVAAALGGGAAATMVPGAQRSQIADTERLLNDYAGNRAMGLNGRVERVQGVRVETRLPFVDATTGSPVVAVQVTAGAGVRTAAINMVTQSVPYAKYQVRGLDIDFQFAQALANGSAAAEALINILITSLVVNGGFNLFYNTQSAWFVGESINNHLSARRTLTGIRDNPILERTNTATLAATFRQEATTTLVLNATFQAALICDVLEDDQVTGRLAA